MTLDDKLEEILNRHRNGLTPNNDRIPLEDSIAQIKQIFRESYWMLSPEEAKKQGLMTGSEWLNRFEKELEQGLYSNWPYKLEDKTVIVIPKSDIKEAAKRASGL